MSPLFPYRVTIHEMNRYVAEVEASDEAAAAAIGTYLWQHQDRYRAFSLTASDSDLDGVAQISGEPVA